MWVYKDGLREAAAKYGITFNTNKTVRVDDKIELLGCLMSQGEVRPDPERRKPLRETSTPSDEICVSRHWDALSLFAVGTAVFRQDQSTRGRENFSLAAACKARLR